MALFVIHPGSMAFSSLVRACGLRAVVAGAGLAVLAACPGCHNGAAGGRAGDSGVDNAPEVVVKLPPPDASCPADAAGGGACPINFCGAPKVVSALALGELAQLGADALCTPGDVCVPDVATASGDALLLRCVEPFTPSIQFGAACTKGTGVTNRCKNDALCIEAPGAPGQPFCSALCRADADCPTDAYCFEYKSATLPKGSYVNLGFCTPKAKIAGAICAREADCAADAGCVSAGMRTNLLTCQKVGGTKSMGAGCATGAECRSGQCSDRAFHANANRSSCSGPCGKSSDCGADQRCALVVLGNNGTPADPRDDLVAGLCQSLFVPIADDGCKADTACTGVAHGGTTCATKYGLCYTAGAPTGAPCAADAECELGAVCTTNQAYPGGYCQTVGCAPGAAAGSADSCPGAHPTCAQRGSDRPLHACYEGCTRSTDCSRYQQSYVCEMADGTPVSTAPNLTDGGATDAGASDAAGSDAGASDADAGARDADAASSTDAASSGDGPASGAETGPLSLCLYNQGV
jgi:hypothetical protein